MACNLNLQELESLVYCLFQYIEPITTTGFLVVVTLVLNFRPEIQGSDVFGIIVVAYRSS